MAEQDASPLRRFESSKLHLEWIVLVEDFPGKELERLDVRHKHVEHVEPRLYPKTGEGEPMKIRGVAPVIKASSAEEALEEVELDPYYTQGVWDPSTSICAVRTPGGYHVRKL
ncbi:hypothetical protein N431DRAFT_492603 [Stipitochalara longipes BDJ]|nr:hypothetical protein N431DRAFT_492603 [Stipitochalara longipes BDJ]